MSITKTKRMAAAALFATAAFAGCGGDSSDDQSASTPPVAATTAEQGTTAATQATSPEEEQARAAIATTPEGTWASRTCKAIAGKAEELTPPKVDNNSPEATQKGLVTFFTDVVDQLGSQINTLEDVGPPPGAKLESEWKKALSQLRGVRKDVAKAVRGVKSADAKTPEDIQAVVTDLGTQLQKMATYEGPVAELKKNETLKPALEAEPTCAKVS